MGRIRILGALLLGAVMVTYAAAWTYYTQQTPDAFLGITRDYDPWARHLRVRSVELDSAAARAGLRVDDAIVAINGEPLDTPGPFNDGVVRGKPGDTLRLTVRRPGTPGTLEMTATLDAGRLRSPARTGAQRLALSPLLLYPIPAIVVALVVLAMRVHDRNAWLLALIFAGLGTGPLETVESLSHPAWRSFLVSYSLLFSGLSPAFFYALMSVFPARSALDRRVPWVTPVLVAAAAVFFVPYAAAALISGSLWSIVRAFSPAGMRALDRVTVTFSLLAWILGFVSLLLNCGRAVEPEARRKARLLGWSFAVGLVPWMALVVTAFYLQRGLFDLPFWLWVPCALLMMLVPVLFGYAVVKHRVLGFSVLVRRSARYVFVQRGFVLLALALSVAVTAVFVAAISRVLPHLTDAALPAGIAAGTLFGLALFLTGGAVATQVTRRIDRAFFRGAYDARQILEDLARQTALAQDRDELAALLDGQLRQALHPRRLDIYLRDQSGALRLFVRGAPDSPGELDVPPALAAKFAEGGRPCSARDEAMPCSALAAMSAECVVPMLSRRRALVGLIVLGDRLSEELYSREDETLLASIASQAGGALENLLLAEQMAERMEADRRAAQELRIAAEVQRRLLPVKTAAMATIEYAGRCVQARSVGGDYYDFLDLGRGQLGLVLGDVSGKGLYAALLMANLQASVRSLSARLATEDLTALLASLDHSFDEATAGNHFATLFFGHYDDVRRRLRYANCGHQPPFLLRAGGGVERLGVTGGAIGLLDEWTCAVEEIVLEPGDLLALYSDGVTEAMSPTGEEFGEARLLEALSLHRDRPLTEAMERVVGAVRAFGGAEQSDDLTLVLVRARPEESPGR